MNDYSWKSISPLCAQDRAIDLAETRSVYETWKIAKERLQRSRPSGYGEFNKRLVRRLSIETGILEHLYDIDRGTTEALVTSGFVEEIVSRDIEPSRLIDILKDHEAAIQLVMDGISGNRPLSVGIIHELHSILTRHEDTTTAMDQFGNRREIPLLKGKFKEFPNNPRRPDGSVHEYCPPVHVGSEIDNLLQWYDQYANDDPVLVAAWLHHRFTQIHPYQDGNGRVARTLTTLVLLKADLLPLVIDRDLRVEYITALESADAENLAPLANLFARLERTAIMQALSVDEDDSQPKFTSEVIAKLAQKFERRREEKDEDLRKVNDVARALRGNANEALNKTFAGLEVHVKKIAKSSINIEDGGTGTDKAHWYRSDVIFSAKASEKWDAIKVLGKNGEDVFVNFDEDHYFVKASMSVGKERLVFVTSFHHVGRELSGIMEATSFARLETEGPDERITDFFLCSIEPFVFTNKTTLPGITAAFARWLDAAIALAIKEFGDRL